jgi:hypothetical protein
MAMNDKGFYNNYKNLIYTGITLWIAISILVKDDNYSAYGLVILSISVGFLLTFFQQYSSEKFRKTFNILSFVIPISVFIYAIVGGFFK